jgi:hypothetical protein
VLGAGFFLVVVVDVEEEFSSLIEKEGSKIKIFEAIFFSLTSC